MKSIDNVFRINPIFRTGAIVALAILMLLIAGCGNLQMSLAGATVEPEAQATEPMIILKEEGGIAGLSKTWEIYADGTVIDPRGEEKQIRDEDVMRLMSSLDARTLLALEEQEDVEAPCCDQFVYTVTFQVDGTEHNFSISDSQFQETGELQEFVGELQSLLAVID